MIHATNNRVFVSNVGAELAARILLLRVVGELRGRGLQEMRGIFCRPVILAAG